MKKLLLILVLLIPTIVFADYYDVQHYKVIPDTITIRNDFYYRGSMHIGKSSYTVDAESIPIYIILHDTGTIDCLRLNASTVTATEFIGIASTATYALDSDALDGYNYTHFVDTTTNQTIAGQKTFSEQVTVNADSRLTNLYTSGSFGLLIDNVSLETIIMDNYSTGMTLYGDKSKQQLNFGIGSDYGRQLIITDTTNRSKDHDHASQTSPTLFIHSEQNPDTDNTQWISISYSSATNVANFDVGGSSVSFNMTGFNIPNMLVGATQEAAGASIGEFWADSDDDYTIKLGQ